MRRVVWTVVYALSMAFVESAVVVYLRALAHGGPFADAADAVLPPGVLGIEITREAATLVMLAATAALAGRDRWERFLLFSLAFAVWDLGYYGWLWILSGWPRSLLAWDVLFLIPVPWAAPVLAPVLVSLEMIVGSGVLLRLHAAGRRPGLRIGTAGVAAGGAFLIFSSFVVDFRTTSAGRAPEVFHWGLFVIGLAIAGMALTAAARAARPRP